MHDAKERTANGAITLAHACPMGTILVVGPPATSIGGMATVVAQMVGLAERRGLPFAFLPLTETPGGGESFFAKLKRHVRFTGELVRRVRTDRATVVHLHTCSGASFLRSIVDGIAVRRAGARLVLHIHGAKFDEFFQNSNLIFQRIIRGTLERADAVIALSAGWKERLLEIAPAARIVVVENAVEEPAVRRERSVPAERVRVGATPVATRDAPDLDGARLDVAADRHCSQNSGTQVLGVASRTLAVARMGHPHPHLQGEDHCSQSSGTQASGDPSPTLAVARMGHPKHAPIRFVTLMRLDTWKGVDELLLAAEMLAGRGVNFELTIAGPEGSAYSESTLRGRVASLGLAGRVRYAGVVVGREKSELLASSDVYVQSSHHEGLPVAVLEAMVHGLAVVATAVGATPEFVEPERHGLLVPAKDAGALARAMEAIALDPHRREAMGSACGALAKTRFSIERFERELLSVYSSITKE